MIHVRTVHSVDDEVIQTFSTMEEALATVRSQEKSRHGDHFEIETFTWKYQTKDFLQFGTDYHYIEIREI